MIDLRDLIKGIKEGGIGFIEIRDFISGCLYFQGYLNMFESLDPIASWEKFDVISVDFVLGGKDYPIIYILDDKEVMKL